MKELNKKTQDSILSIIKDQMPQHVGGALSERLKQADQMEKDLEDAKRMNDHLVKQSLEIDREIYKLKEIIESFEGREKDIVSAEKSNFTRSLELDAKDRDLEMQLLKRELELTKESRTEIHDLTDRVFRNHVVRETVMKNTHCQTAPNYSENGTYLGDTVVHGGLTGEETTVKKSHDED
jgi:hypothetical protein